MQVQIAHLLANRTNYQEKIKRLSEKYRYVVFYGCGAIYSSIVDTWIEYVGRKIDYCCDSDPKKWGKDFCGAKCLSPQELLEIKSECAIFVTVGVFQPVFDYLRSAGFPSVNLIYKYDLVASAYLDNQNIEAIGDQLERVRCTFSDERSRQVFDVILSRTLGNDGTNLMPSICEPNQYFVPGLVPLSAYESYVDIGAYDGDTLKCFIKSTGGVFEQIHAFELDPANYKLLDKAAQQLPYADRIHIYNLGVWDKEGEVSFNPGKSQSTVGCGESKANVVPLDKILAGQRVSFIKMDIEGAELNALRGAQTIIRQQKPKLAICVYHHLSQLIEVPLYIRGLLPDHKLYLRHHTNLEYETVCYAIPPELVG